MQYLFILCILFLRKEIIIVTPQQSDIRCLADSCATCMHRYACKSPSLHCAHYLCQADRVSAVYPQCRISVYSISGLGKHTGAFFVLMEAGIVYSVNEQLSYSKVY